MTHWKKMTNPNYLGVYSLPDGKDMVLTIDALKQEMVTGADGKQEMCAVCYWMENEKPMIMNKTNLKMIAQLLKTNYIEDWHGKKIQLGSEKVKAFGEVTDALRVRKADMNKAVMEDILCEVCSHRIQPYGNMSAAEMGAYTKKKYGKCLCSDCARKEAAK